MGTDYQELSILKKTHNHDENLPLQPFLVEGRCGYPPQMHLLWLLFFGRGFFDATHRMLDFAYKEIEF